MKEFFERLENIDDARESQLKNVLVLAFVGDSLYTAFVRTHLATHSALNSGKLNTISNMYVKAPSQAKVFEQIKDGLTQAELDVARRARNCKLHHTAKNATLEDYKTATSFESVLGYNYLAGNIDRLMQLMHKSVEIVDNWE